MQVLQQGAVVQAPLILNQVVIDPIGVPIPFIPPNPVVLLPPVVVPDAGNIGDSSDDELNDIIMTENVIAPPPAFPASQVRTRLIGSGILSYIVRLRAIRRLGRKRFLKYY